MNNSIVKFECTSCEMNFYIDFEDKCYATYCPNCNSTFLLEKENGMKIKNDTEKHVAELAIMQYREKQTEYKEIKELLATKKFKYGDYVVKKGTSYFDDVFGTREGSIGKIVWFEEEQDYYRVRYGKDAPWIGTNEDSIELYEGEVPQHLIDYDIKDSTYIQFRIQQNKL